MPLFPSGFFCSPFRRRGQGGVQEFAMFFFAFVFIRKGDEQNYRIIYSFFVVTSCLISAGFSQCILYLNKLLWQLFLSLELHSSPGLTPGYFCSYMPS